MTRHIASAALLLLAIQMSFAAQSPPGWNFALFTETPATIEDAWLPSEKDGGGTKALTTGGETEVTDEIQALAAALQNDPVRIYEYVRDHISYEPTYGQRKGAQGTLLSGRGNDLDQSALLVALLNAADPSSDAQFVKAQVDYTQAFLGNLCDTPAAKARLTLYNLGIPASAAGSNVRVVHFWVEATVDSQTRVLDPAFVECERVTGATLSSLLGYDRNTFIDNATNGATIGTDYIEDINYANITNDLLSFTTNALAEIQEDYATATVGEFLGEARNTESPVTSLPTSLPHAVQIVGGTRVEYTEIPDSLHAKVTINHRGIVRTLKAYEIAAKRITITYVGGSKYATLMIDGDTDTTGASTTQGQKYDCTLTLTTPYQSGTLSGAHTHSLTSGESYAVLAEFGVATPSVLQRFREQISRARADGASDTSEAVLCGALNLLGHTYAQQLRLAASVAGKSIGALGDYLLCGGIVRQEDGYGIDLAIQYYRGYYLTGTSAEVLSAYRTAGLMGSAFEHAVFEQAQGSDKPAASTVKLLWKGNGDGHRTYLADSANWSTVQGQLQGYDAPTISAIGGWISSGFKVMLPRRGDLAIGDWEGAGYLAYYAGSSFSTAYVISGDLNGGAGGYLGDLDINTVLEGLDLTIYDSSFDYNPTFGADPVDLFTGDLAHSKRFLALGSEPPRGLGLSGLYNSGQSDQESTLGYGWRHSLDIAATRISHPEPSAGLRQPADLVPLIVRCVVVGDLLKNECNLKGWLISSLVTKWQADQMTDNAVAVRMGNRTLEYVRMPDGSYNPPPGVTATLSLAQPMQWGANGDIPVPADYDGDGIVDAAVFRPSTGHWIIRRSSDGGVTDTGYGSAGDLPAPADYDGDGVVDIAVFRPSNQTWYRWGSSTGGYAPYVWGLLSSDLPVPADYDGDGYADVAVYQTNGTWHLAQTSAGYAGLALGGEIGDKPVPADYDGDGHLDMAIYQANATWHISRSSQGYVGFVWQQAGDLPVPADYDGDGVADAAVYRPATGLLYVHGVDASVATQYLGAAYSQAFAGDFDGDGIAQVGSLNTDTFDWYISGICDGLYRLNKRYGMEYRFNTDGHLGSIVDADGKTLSLSYNAQTNLQTVTDAYSRTLTFSYSGDKVSSVSDSTGRSVSFGYTDSDLTSFTDPDSKIWTYQYDDDHRIVATLDPLSQVTVSNIYNAVGQVVTQYNGHGEMWTFHVSGPWGVEVDPEGGQTTHYFDALGQNLGTEDALGNRAYNYYNGQGLLVSNVDARGYATLYQYDSQHNLANRTDALGNTHAFTYDSDNRLASETDPLGHTTTYGYDSAHHITNMVNALTNETLRTYYTSGSHEGLLHTVTDPEGNVTTYTYGTYEKPYTVTRTDGGTVSNTWSARGDLLTRADANGNETTFTYNNRRLLTSFTDPLENTTSNVYNDAGLKTTVIDPLEGETVTAWTPTYKVDSVTYPDGSAVSNVYNSRDWLVAVVDPRGNVSSNVYDAVGRQIAVVDPNGARGG